MAKCSFLVALIAFGDKKKYIVNVKNVVNVKLGREMRKNVHLVTSVGKRKKI